MTPEGAANSTSFKMEGSGSGGGSYALPYVSRKTTDAAVIDSIVWSATSGGTATVTTHSNDAPPHATAGSDDIASDGRCLADAVIASLLSAFDVKAHRIDRRVGAGQHIGNHPLVSSVDLDRTKIRIIGAEEFATAVRMP